MITRLLLFQGVYVIVRGTTDHNGPPWPSKTIVTCMNCLAQEILVRNAELTSYQQPEEFRKGQKKRGDANPNVLPTSQNPSCWNLSWLSNAHNTRKDPESQWLPRDNLETNSIIIKPETVSSMTDQFSWVPSSCFSLPWYPFLIKSLTLWARVSPRTIHSWVLNETLGPWKRSLSYNRITPCLSLIKTLSIVFRAPR